MARGWESKAVESQIEDQREARSSKPERTSEERETVRKRESLELSRTRVMNDLANAHSQVHRTTLEHALAHLDAELAKLR